MDAEEIKDNLDPLYEAAMLEQRDIAAGIDLLTKCAKNFIASQYAEQVNSLSAEGYRALDDSISRHASNLSMEISTILYRHQDEQTGRESEALITNERYQSRNLLFLMVCSVFSYLCFSKG